MPRASRSGRTPVCTARPAISMCLPLRAVKRLRNSRNGGWQRRARLGFKSRSMRNQTGPRVPDLALSDYRIEAAIGGDLELKATTRVKVRPSSSGVRAVTFDISPLMTVTSATVDGRPAEVLQGESPRGNAMRAGNEMFVVAPAEVTVI